ncbi:aldehyde dehydrogenase family protein [Pseudomonas putida]|uniref:Aldehyde dehydrogenase family protein n=1 Tax=Pseudomonas putida TaxID=303 RepID=A0A7D6A259_PSEPU|nr:aldehyde dehydrogenase family protein [Pseudomonas putida]QLJ12604.1 aldehyde dehydrogenase family protein [Pseudomonas putida]
MPRHYEHWINNAEVKPSTGSYLKRFSPAHGEFLAEFPEGSAADVDQAAKAARARFEDAESWSKLPGSVRSKLLTDWAALIERDIESLSVMEAEEVGKPIESAKGEIAWSIELIRYASAQAWELGGDAYNNVGAGKLALMTREPRGVVGMILPWNYPVVTMMQKLPYALAAGCTTVIKSSELTSGTTFAVARLAAEAGIPAGVINVVTGLGAEVGDAISRHPEIDMVSFTGSTAVGQIISKAAAETNKYVALELGGKSANIVFADADIDAALDGVLLGFTLNQGEECVAGSRLLVEESIAEEFVARLVKRANKVKVGLPLDSETQVGALIHEQHMNKVLEYIQSGIEAGAELRCGGKRVTEGGLGGGFFVAPTIFSGVTPEMKIFQEEIFGPVLTVTTFREQSEAVDLANNTVYGLGNGVWTKDIDKAILVSEKLRSGTVYVNTYFETTPQVPFGGYKASGVGRENGRSGLLEFTETKSTFISLGERVKALPNTVD